MNPAIAGREKEVSYMAEKKAEKAEAKEVSVENSLALVEKVKKTGKLKIGINEVTKAVERGVAKAVVVAEDVNPKEIVMHLPALCKEKNIPLLNAPSKKELGEKAGIVVGTAAIAVLEEGDAKKEIDALHKK